MVVQSSVREANSIKVTSMGEGGVGKSCLIKRYCEGKFVSRYIATIGIDYGVKPVKVEDLEVRVNFWDLSGHPEFFDVRNEFYKDTQGAMLVYDVTSKKSFKHLADWLDEGSKYGLNPDKATIVVVGNKIDLAEKNGGRAVAKATAERWASERGFAYFETSAYTGEGVEALFEHLFRAVTKATYG